VGMSSYVLDVTDPTNLRAVAQQVISDYPELNCIVANAGVQRVHNFASD